MKKQSTLKERVQDANETLQLLTPSEKICEHCKHWDWTHNCWGDCNNPKIARSQQWYTDETIVFINSEKDVPITTLQYFGCTLFEKR